MQIEQLFIQLGMGGATLFILWIVVKYFIKTLEKKDDYIADLVGSFRVSLENHMQHNTQALTEQTKALKELISQNNHKS